MLDISWAELLFVAVIAILVIGPKDLPRALRAVGHWTGKARRMAGDFQRQFNEAIREAELDDVKDQVTKIGKIDPIGDVRKELTKAGTGIKDDLEKATKIEPPTVDKSPSREPAAPPTGKPAVETPDLAEPEAIVSKSEPADALTSPPPGVATGEAKS